MPAAQLVRRMTLPTTSGLQEFSWDGVADNGTRAAAGDYTFEAVANVGGKSELAGDADRRPRQQRHDRPRPPDSH